MASGTYRGSGLERAIKLLRRLEGRQSCPSLQRLAADYEVNARTIRRDLEALENAGVTLPTWRREKDLE